MANARESGQARPSGPLLSFSALLCGGGGGGLGGEGLRMPEPVGILETSHANPPFYR